MKKVIKLSQRKNVRLKKKVKGDTEKKKENRKRGEIGKKVIKK